MFSMEIIIWETFVNEKENGRKRHLGEAKLYLVLLNLFKILDSKRRLIEKISRGNQWRSVALYLPLSLTPLTSKRRAIYRGGSSSYTQNAIQTYRRTILVCMLYPTHTQRDRSLALALYSNKCHTLTQRKN